MRPEIKSPFGVAVLLAVFNYIWYLALSRVYLLVGHPYERAVIFSFLTWILSLPFTFWVPYYWLKKRFEAKWE
ncbi:hypothetical protein [Candidatus Pyrohabitans sp.]